MIQIVGNPLNQWDVGRLVQVTGEASHVHFANQGDSVAVIIDIVDGKAKIPDYLLQTGKTLFAYSVLNGVTLERNSFAVRKRERPENYVYEDDQRNYIYMVVDAAKQATAEAKRVTQEMENAWSNLCPMFSVKGSVIICEPLRDYHLEAISHIAATETGVDRASIWHGGKNHFDISKVIGASGTNYVINNGDGTLTINRDSTAYGAPFKLRDYAPGLKAGQTYTLSAKTTSSKKYIYLQGSYNKHWLFGSSVTITEDMLNDSVLWYCETGNTPAVISDIQIEIGIAETAFEVYKGNVFTAEFGKTVYGGSYSWSAGVLTDEYGNITNLVSAEIPALLGVNILCSNTGDTTVTGRTDLKVYIDNMIIGGIIPATLE